MDARHCWPRDGWRCKRSRGGASQADRVAHAQQGNDKKYCKTMCKRMILISLNSRKEDMSALCSNSSTACMSTCHCSHHMPQHRSMLATLSALEWMIDRASQCSSCQCTPTAACARVQFLLLLRRASLPTGGQQPVCTCDCESVAKRSQPACCVCLACRLWETRSCPPQKVRKSPDRFSRQGTPF